ncbi:phenylacetate--CoA ligase [Tardiphaga sp. vice278]|nr:phenylacetate--CoA ligase [Tardiphaga sp. vice278]
MFVRPEQVAEIARRHPELGRLRLVVSRQGETDSMTLLAEAPTADEAVREAVTATLRDVSKLGGTVTLMSPGSFVARQSGWEERQSGWQFSGCGVGMIVAA